MVQPSRDCLVDSRVAQRNIRDGRLAREDFEKHLASLPDLKDKSEDIGEEIYGTRRPGVALTGDYISNEQDDEE